MKTLEEIKNRQAGSIDGLSELLKSMIFLSNNLVGNTNRKVEDEVVDVIPESLLGQVGKNQEAIEWLAAELWKEFSRLNNSLFINEPQSVTKN